MPTNEKQLIAHILSGHAEDFGYFLEHYGPQVFAVAARIVGTQMDAEEIAQDTFMRAFQHLGSYHGDAQFGTWLSRIAYRCSINYLRKRKWDNIDIDEQKLADISDEQASEALQVTDEERKELLRRAIQMLRPEDRSLIMMFYFDNRTMREIVYILDMSTTNINKSINTLAARITRIRKKLYLIIKQLENENG